MKSIRILVLSSLLLFSATVKLQAGIFNQAIGARSAGLGFTGITLTDFWSAIHNQAGLASIKKSSAGIYVENEFLLKSLSTHAFAFIQPVANGSFGLSMLRFGETAFNETMIALSYGHKLSKEFLIGIQLFHYAINQSNHHGMAGVFSFQGGFIYTPAERISIAFHIFSPHLVNHSSTEIKLAEIVTLGLGYHLSESLQGFIEFQNHSKLGQGLNSGLEIQSPRKLAFRVGYSSFSKKFTFGIGLKIKKLSIDFGSSMHNQLGYSPQLSLSYAFGK